MRVSVSDAKAQLTELVRRAETGDEIILTRHGQATVRLVPVLPLPDRQTRKAAIKAVRAAAADKLRLAGAADVGDPGFLYGDDGMPE